MWIQLTWPNQLNKFECGVLSPVDGSEIHESHSDVDLKHPFDNNKTPVKSSVLSWFNLNFRPSSSSSSSSNPFEKKKQNTRKIVTFWLHFLHFLHHRLLHDLRKGSTPQLHRALHGAQRGAQRTDSDPGVLPGVWGHNVEVLSRLVAGSLISSNLRDFIVIYWMIGIPKNHWGWF